MFHKHISRFVACLSIISMLLGAIGIPQVVYAAPAGTALQFNGTSQYVTFGSAPSLGVTTFTIETWFKRTGAGAGTSTGSGGVTAIPLVTKGRAESEGSNVDMNYFLGIDSTSSKLVADFEEGSSTGGTLGLNHPVSGNTVVTSNVWHHVAATYDGQTWKLYLDGAVDGTVTLSVARPPRSDSVQHAGLGTAMNSTGVAAGFFQGSLDEARIWNYARSQADIQASMNQEITSGTGLLGRWGMNEGSGTAVINSVSGGVSGTAANGPTWVSGFPIPDTTPPAAPQSLSANAGNGLVTLSWIANTEIDLAGYNVYRNTSSPVATSGTPLNGSTLVTNNIYTDNSLANGTTYYYAITAVDTSNNQSIASNEVNSTPQAFAGGALQFNGSNQNVTFGAVSGLGTATFTLETWFKRTGAGVGTNTGSGGVTNAIPLVTKGRAEAEGSNVDMNYFLGIDANTGVLVADFEEGSTGASPGLNHPVFGITAVTNNVWHHVAATYDGTTWKLYLDGALDKQLSVGQPPRSDSIQHAALATAMNSTGVAAGFFQGTLDEARIWNYARTQTQIQSSMNAEITSAPGLLGRWGMNEGSGTVVSNSAGSINGTATNGPIWVAGYNLGSDTPPTAPQNLTATAAPGSVSLIWDANSETDLAGYNIYKGTTAGGPYTKVSTSLGTGTSYSDSTLTNGTTYYYVVTAIDASNNESTYSAEVSATPMPEPGAYGLDFGSGSAYVTFGDPTKLDLSQFTIETWFKRTGNGTPNTTGSGGIPTAIPLVTHGAAEQDGSNLDANWILAIDDATDVLAADFEDMATGANHPVRGTTVITSNVWHHAAATYDGSMWHLYLDGKLEATLVANAAPRSDSIQKAGLGTMLKSDGTSLGHFQGVLDEARIWNLARSQAEIAGDISNELTNGNALVARWGFSEGAGTVVGDSISSAANGTITGTGSNWVAGTPFNLDLTPPAAPQNLTAVGTNTQVSLSWDANTETDLAGYNLYRATMSGGLYTKLNGSLLTSTSYTDIGLMNGTTYYYVITAVDTSANMSEYSTEVSAMPHPGANGLDFGNGTGYVTFGDPAKLDLSQFTIETWFKRTGTGTSNTTGTNGILNAIPLVTHGAAEAEGSAVDANWILAIDDSTDVLAADFEDMAGGANHPVYGTTVISNNVWHHAAATYDGTTWHLYLDGRLEATLVVNAAPRSDSIQGAGLGTMIKSDGGPLGHFQGVLDEVRVWNLARTQTQIDTDINNELLSGDGLVTRWGFGEGEGTTVGDSIAPAADGTIMGSGTSWIGGAPFNLAVDITAPVAPQNLTATGSNEQVSLSWDANTEIDLAGYNVYRSTVAGGPYSKLNASLVTATAYSDTGLTNGTPYYYAVTAVDASTNESNDSAEVSAIPQAGAYGLDFGSGNAYVTFGDPAKLDLSQFTIETWFKRTGTGTPNTTGTNGIPNAIPLVTHGAPQADGSNVDANWILAIDDTNDVLAADFEDMATGANHPVYGTTIISNNVWHHAAASYDGTTWRLYLDSRLEATLVANAAPRSDTIQQAGLGTMLTSTGTPNGHFQGLLDEVRVWNIARSQANIVADINNELTSGTGLVARWGFGEGTGTTVADSIAVAANGTITGTSFSWVAGAPFDLGVDITAPTAPQNLVANASNAQVSLTWNVNSEPDLAGYNIYRSTTSPVSTVTPLNGSLLSSPSFTDASVTNGTTYYYVVTAIDTSNNASVASNEVNATPMTGSGALQFDGTNDYVTFGPAPSLGSASFTIETWFQRTGAGVGTNTGSSGIASAIPLMTKGRAESEGSTVDMNYFMGIDSATGKLVADFEDMATGANHPVSGVTVISSNSWHHAAATYDGTTWRLYLDGNLETTLAVSQTPRFDSIQHAALGTAMNSTGVAAGFFQGVLDESRVWNYARTQTEIQNSLHSEVTSVTGLIGRWSLNEGAGTIANDSSGNGLNGTLTNGPAWVAGTTFNLPPRVNAGPDQSVGMAGGVNLPGTVADDGFPNPPATLIITWSKVSGPGTATFSNPSAADTSALFSVAGTYVLRLSANDGEATSSDDVTVTVSASLGGNTALDFGGTNAYVNFSNPAKLHLSTFTIETWFRREGTGLTTTTGTGGTTNAIPLVARGRGEAENPTVDLNYFLGIDATTNTLVADFEEGAGGTSPSLNHPVFGTTAIPANSNTWHHAAATYDGTTWKLYLDGNLESSLTVGQPAAAAGNQYASIGSALTSTGVAAGFFDGVMDESRIWDHALAQAEIQGNMPLELTSGNGLVVRWGLNEGAGTVVNDAIAAPANGSVLGSNYTWVNGPSFTVNQPPTTPVLNSPADGATGVSTSPVLDVAVSDPDSNNLTVSFYGRPASTTPPVGPDFTIIPMPDTQHYTDNGGSNAANFSAQTQWIVDNKASRNIVFVTGLGDIVENGDTTDSEWQIADSAYRLIEDPRTTLLANGIPFGLAVGNHDQSPIGGGSSALTSKYNQYFGVSRFEGRGYYGGHYGSDNDNNYELFSASGMDFIIIHFEYDTTPEQSVLDWADSLLTTYSDRRAILTTHYMIDTGNPGAWGAQGQAIYNALSDHANVFLMLGGHVPGEGRRQDTAVNGNVVNTLLSDYQSRANGGNGWLRIMTFSPANNTISVKTYSPVLNQFETDGDSQFTFSYDMQGGSVPFTALGTQTNVPSGSNTNITWPNLTDGRQYEWYVTVTDGNKTTTSSTYTFTTTNPVASNTPTGTATGTATYTPTVTYSPTPSNTATVTPTPSITPTATDTPTITLLPSATPVFTNTPTNTPTFTPSAITSTFTSSPTQTPTFTPTPSAQMCKQAGASFVFEYLGYVTDSISGQTTITYRGTNNSRQSVNYIAIGIEGFTPIAPANGSTYTDSLGNYTVIWTDTTGAPGFTSIKFQPKFKSFKNGASDVFSITVTNFDPNMTIQVAGQAGTSPDERFSFLLSQTTCPADTTATPTATQTPIAGATNTPTPTATVKPTKTPRPH